LTVGKCMCSAIINTVITISIIITNIIIIIIVIIILCLNYKVYFDDMESNSVGSTTEEKFGIFSLIPMR